MNAALASLCLLAACEREPKIQALAPAALNAAEAEALQRMNEAGNSPFAGWTWRYEFGAGCRLRVIKRFEGRLIPPNEYVLSDHHVEIIPFAGSGFGVKAYPRSKPGSADLFDARTQAQASAFAKDIEQLINSCAQPAEPREKAGPASTPFHG
ncbi:MAG: hypothetical protein H7Z19_06285 [Chitinophagaceae bacterium]|nr:hypothetical protein [Rubrivivax sp.]